MHVVLRELMNNFGDRIVSTSEINAFLSNNGRRMYSSHLNSIIKDYRTTRGFYKFSSNSNNPSINATAEQRNQVESPFITTFCTDQTFGVELEFCSNVSGDEINEGLRGLGLMAPVEGDGSRYSMSGRNISYSNWNITYDTSVRGRGFSYGLEIVSPILSGRNGLKDLKKVMDYLTTLEKAKKIKVNKTCGTHVHFSKNNWQSYNEFQGYEFFKTYAMNEHIIDLIQPVSRRGDSGRYCKSCLNAINNSSYSPSGRYYKVNMSHIRTRGTVEVRQHSGTVDFEKMASWIHLMTALLNKSTKLLSSSKRYQTLNEMMEDLGVESCVKEFLKKRFKKLNGYVEELAVAV